MITTPLPLPIDTLCGGCRHSLGEHYVRNDGKNGCAYVQRDQREGVSICTCDGFLIRYQPAAPFHDEQYR